MQGICTLANDIVYDQVVALLNSIDQVLGSDIPVCIYPFDDQLKKVSQFIKSRNNVFIYQDQASLDRWDQFMLRAAPERLNPDNSRLYGAHRRFCAFDGPFDQFIYMDADTLAMNSMAMIWEKLQQVDWVVYDFQFLDPSKVYNLKSPRIFEVFSSERIASEIFCSGFYGGKRGLFDQGMIRWLLEQLNRGEREILYEGAGEQPLINYMVMRSGISSYNFAYDLPSDHSTGCCATSRHFQEQDHILYDRGNRLTYLHYIGVPPDLIRRVGAGENIEFPYRDLFLYYRYLHEPEKQPIFTTLPVPYRYKSSHPWKRLWRKLWRDN